MLPFSAWPDAAALVVVRFAVAVVIEVDGAELCRTIII